MSNNIPTLSNSFTAQQLESIRVAIVTASWNGHITSRLQSGAVDTLIQA